MSKKSKRAKHLALVADRSATVARNAVSELPDVTDGLAQFIRDRGLSEVQAIAEKTDASDPLLAEVETTTPEGLLQDADDFLQDHLSVIAVTVPPIADRRETLAALNITDLRKYSKGSGIPGAYGLKKPQLIEAIVAARWFGPS